MRLTFFNTLVFSGSGEDIAVVSDILISVGRFSFFQGVVMERDPKLLLLLLLLFLFRFMTRGIPTIRMVGEKALTPIMVTHADTAKAVKLDIFIFFFL